MKKINSRILLGALNILAVASPLLASQTSQTAAKDKKIEALNTVSLKSIESAWFKVPALCKARAFHAEPVSLEQKEISSHIQNIYSSFGV